MAQTYEVNITINNNDPQYSNVPYAQLPDPVPMEHFNENGDEEAKHAQIQPDDNNDTTSNKPLLLFVISYNFTVIIYASSVLIESFHVSLISLIILLIISMIATKWVDKGCICFGCDAAAFGGVTDWRLTAIYSHFIFTVIVIICCIVFYQNTSNTTSLIVALIAFCIAQLLGIGALWKRKRIQY